MQFHQQLSDVLVQKNNNKINTLMFIFCLFGFLKNIRGR